VAFHVHPSSSVQTSHAMNPVNRKAPLLAKYARNGAPRGENCGRNRSRLGQEHPAAVLPAQACFRRNMGAVYATLRKLSLPRP
jgi:hypothetical protein